MGRHLLSPGDLLMGKGPGLTKGEEILERGAYAETGSAMPPAESQLFRL